MFGGLAFTVYGISVAHVNDLVDRVKVLQVTGGLLLLNGMGATIGPTLAGGMMDLIGPEALMLYFSVVLAALAALGLLEAGQDHGGFALWSPLVWTVTLEHEGEALEARIACEGPDQRRVMLGADAVQALRQGGRWHLDGQVAPDVKITGDLVTVFTGAGLGFRFVDPLARDAAAAGDGNLIEAPMPGLVKAGFPKVWQAVQAGDRLAVLEAMKMEHALLAARDGVVAEVLVTAGAQVEAGAALVRLEDEVEAALEAGA